MAKFRRKKRLIRGYETLVEMRAKLNRGVKIADYYEIEQLLAGRSKVTRDGTHLLFAMLTASEIISFAKSRKSDAVVGINKKLISYISTSGKVRKKGSLKAVRWFGDQNTFLTQLLAEIKKFTDLGATGSLLPLNKPHAALKDKDIIPVFNNRITELTWHLADIMEKLNAGHHATSLIMEDLEGKIERRKALSRGVVKEVIGLLQNILSPQELEDIKKAKTLVNVEDLSELNPKYRPHQYQWMVLNYIMKVGKAIIGLDTGLGKTLIAIVGTYLLKRQGLATGAIVFTRAKVIPGFHAEIKSVWPSARVVSFDSLNKTQREERASEAAAADFILCSYGPLSTGMPEMMELFQQEERRALFFDEGSCLRNVNTTQTQNAKILIDQEYRDWVFILDATPFSNDPLREAHRLIDILRPLQLGTMRSWLKRFGQREIIEADGRQIEVYKRDAMEKMREALEPFMFILKSDDELVDQGLMPDDARIFDQKFVMGPEQTVIYDAVLDDYLESVLSIHADDSIGDIQNALVRIQRLRQCSVSPYLLDPGYAGDNTRIGMIVELARKWLKQDPTSGVAITATYTNKLFPLIEKALLEGIDDLRKDDIVYVTGKTSGAKQVSAATKKINSGEARITFLGMKSAGAGMNLQQNVYRVIVVHEPWNPDDMYQLISRFNRQGQKNRVQVAIMMATETAKGEEVIDSRVRDILNRKRHNQKGVLEGGELAPDKVKFDRKTLIEMSGLSLEEAKARLQRKSLDNTPDKD